MKHHKYPIGTVLHGNKSGKDKNKYRITGYSKNSYGGTPHYDLVSLTDGDIHDSISETTIDLYNTKAPVILDDGLFTL